VDNNCFFALLIDRRLHIFIMWGCAGSGRDAARRFVTVCFAWTWVWVTWGNSSGGRHAYQRLSAWLAPNDAKGILPIITLAIPILSAAVVARAVGRSRSSHKTAAGAPVRSAAASRGGGGGDPNFDAHAAWMIVLPLCAYVASALMGSLGTTTMSVDEKISKVANALGLASLIALCLSFVPVARHSPILKVLGWNPAAAIRLHAWSGRVVVIFGLAHSAFHLVRFRRRGYPLVSVFVPPSECWVLWRSSDTISDCWDEENDCSCYNRWRNLLGASGAAFLLIITLSSLNVVRRRFYSMFYRIHVVAGPLVLLCVVLHWSRSILYLAGGLIYYMASSFALLLEQRLNDQQSSSVEVVEVQHLPTSSSRSDRHIVAITVAATESALSQFRAGYYVQLRAPDISPISHPFTINRVPHQPYLRILLRAEGGFTRRLSGALCTFNNASLLVNDQRRYPRIHLDGYHGAERLHDVIHHDRLVIIAGGIGITPYLSLLRDLLVVPPPKDRTRTVVLHWCCRDKSLIAYVEREFFSHLAFDTVSLSARRMRIIIHNTKRMTSLVPSYSSFEDSHDSDSSRLTHPPTPCSISVVDGSPFCPSSFASISIDVHRWDLGLSFATPTFMSLVTTWVLYSSWNGLEDFLPRILPPVALTLICICCAHISVRASPSLQTKSLPDSSMFEMGGAPCTSTLWVDGEACYCGVLAQRVPVQKSAGRPVIEDMLSDLQVSASEHPGLMVCGPPSFLRKVCSDLRKDYRNAQVSVYEEKFEL
jgi:predicted ferric reductase